MFLTKRVFLQAKQINHGIGWKPGRKWKGYIRKTRIKFAASVCQVLSFPKIE